MYPTKLTAIDPESERQRYKVVRRDTCEDLPGLILSASVEEGRCILQLPDGKTQEHNYGPGGLTIVPTAA